MSISYIGMQSKINSDEILIKVPQNHKLLSLANVIDWQKLSDLVDNDLKSTTAKGKWWLGRKLKLRIHLAAYILQKIYNKTDRQIEQDIKDNAVYQLFCGKNIIKNWHCPDHTKIESFRSRLSPETQKNIANEIAVFAVKLGIADPSSLDVDSTVQEANITYPTDAKMLKKLGMIANKVAAIMKSVLPESKSKNLDLNVDTKDISKKSRKYFFAKKRIKQEDKKSILQTLYDAVSEPVLRVTSLAKEHLSDVKDSLNYHSTNAIDTLLLHAESYLISAQEYIDNSTASENKLLSFHAGEVACFNKNKSHKNYEFGRNIQIGRLDGNILIVTNNDTVTAPDKTSLVELVDEHEKLFGKNIINSIATDKGYYSKENVKAMEYKKISEIGIQEPENLKKSLTNLSEETKEVLRNRRSGIEPLIGHAKHGGQLGRSRMKKDINSKSAAFASITGFNLRQIMNWLPKNYNSEVLMC